MSLTLLPSLDSPFTQESLKLEVTCSGRAVSRPALSSQASFTSSHSSPTDISTPSRRSRPTLSPEALLTHAFGPAALRRLTPPPPHVASSSSISESSQSTSSSACSSSCSSSSSGRRKRDCLPAPPPPGTFRSVAKPSKGSESPSQLSLSELNPFRMHTRQTTGELISCMPSRDFERVAEREPPMSPVQWREKADERLQRRKLLRLKPTSQGVGKLPLDIDCRPMAGSMGLPPVNDYSKTRKPKVNERSPASAGSAVSVANDVKDKKEQLFSAEEEEDKTVIGEAPDWPKSMVEMKEIVNLVKQCDAICLKNLSG